MALLALALVPALKALQAALDCAVGVGPCQVRVLRLLAVGALITHLETVRRVQPTLAVVVLVALHLTTQQPLAHHFKRDRDTRLPASVSVVGPKL